MHAAFPPAPLRQLFPAPGPWPHRRWLLAPGTHLWITSLSRLSPQLCLTVLCKLFPTESLAQLLFRASSRPTSTFPSFSLCGILPGRCQSLLLRSSRQDRERYRACHCSKHLKRDSKALEGIEESKENDAGTRRAGGGRQSDKSYSFWKGECERRYRLCP